MFQSPSDKKPGEEEEYVGNIWGWKFSLFGLALILVMLSIMIYRHYVLDVPFNEGFEIESPINNE